MKLISSGAEASVFLDEQGRIVKERVPQAYRHAQLDHDLRRSRTRREAALLRKVPVPAPKLIDTDGESRIVMEHIDGVQLKRLLDEDPALARLVGESLARLHDADIIHGDLTTSNMILRTGVLHLIDFGLGFTSAEAEDKAVDIHLLRQALESKHYRVHEQAFSEFTRGYACSKGAPAVLERLKEVERRGRNKVKV